MKPNLSLAALLALGLLLGGPLAAQVPGKINYRGYLKDFLPTTADLRFDLYSSEAAGTPLKTIDLYGVNVYDGNFSVLLDFQAADFDVAPGGERWLAVSAGGVEQSRQQVITVPYAFRADTVSDGAISNNEVNPAAAIAWSKISKSGSSLADLAARSAGDLSTGTLNNGRFSAYSDLSSEGYLDNNNAADLLSQSQADGRYVNVTGDSMTGNFTVDGSTFHVDTANNRVGVGTASPAGTLHLYGSGGWDSPLVYLQHPSYGTSRMIQAGDGLLFRNFYASGTQNAFSFRNSADTRLMVIRADGNVGINTYTPSAKLHVNGDARVENNFTVGDGSVVSWLGSGSKSLFADAYAARFENTNTASGNSGVAVTVHNSAADTSALRVQYAYLLPPTPFLQYRTLFLVKGDGNATLYGTLTEGSDARYKHDVEDLSGSLDKVLRLRGVSYERKRGGQRTADGIPEREIGLIGQEVHGVVPEAAARDGEGYYSVAYTRLVPVLVEAIKEQQAVIDAQRDQLGALRTQIRELESVRRDLQIFQERMAALEAAVNGRN